MTTTTANNKAEAAAVKSAGTSVKGLKEYQNSPRGVVNTICGALAAGILNAEQKRLAAALGLLDAQNAKTKGAAVLTLKNQVNIYITIDAVKYPAKLVRVKGEEGVFRAVKSNWLDSLKELAVAAELRNAEQAAAEAIAAAEKMQDEVDARLAADLEAAADDKARAAVEKKIAARPERRGAALEKAKKAAAERVEQAAAALASRKPCEVVTGHFYRREAGELIDVTAERAAAEAAEAERLQALAAATLNETAA